jgi:dimethylaniline monooxygenase (N-oxide forming)
MVFGFTVTKIEKQNGRWAVQGECNEAKSTVVYHTPKLMVASGLTSTPNMPIFAKQDCFKGLILHQRDFGQSSVLSSSDKYITVLEGAKSAADMAYAYAKAGKSVSWVIRSSGSGLAAFLGS